MPTIDEAIKALDFSWAAAWAAEVVYECLEVDTDPHFLALADLQLRIEVLKKFKKVRK